MPPKLEIEDPDQQSAQNTFPAKAITKRKPTVKSQVKSQEPSFPGENQLSKRLKTEESQALKGPQESTLQEPQTQNFSGQQSQASHVNTEADLRKLENNTSIKAYFFNSLQSEKGKGAQKNDFQKGQMGSQGSRDQKTGGQFDEIICFSGPSCIKAKSKMGPASSVLNIKPSVNISQKPNYCYPEEDPGLVKPKTP